MNAAGDEPSDADPMSALRGWPGGPGLAVPSGIAADPHDSAPQSAWQQADGLWRDFGIRWERPSGSVQAPAHPQAESPQPQSRRTTTFVIKNLPPGAPPYVATVAAASEPDDAYDYEAEDEEAYDDDAEDEDADELYQAWRGNTGPGWAANRTSRFPETEYPRVPRTRERRVPQRRPERRRAGRVVLPVLVIIAVGAVAVALLSHRTTMPLAERGNRSPATPIVNAAGFTALASFAAYPDQQGRDGSELGISSVAAAVGEQLAVGSTDGYPAIWRRGPGDSWSLARGAADGVLAGRPGIETLAAVTHGPAGWLAVGGVISGAAQHPVVVISPEGATWQAADGAPVFGVGGVYAYGATAGQADYVIVGEQVSGNRVIAATWWSAGLGGWTRGGNGDLDGRLRPSAMFAVATVPDGFIAVGSHGSGPAVWTSPDGRQWTVTDVPSPAGASGAVLRQVAAHGARVVATGDAVTAKGTMPFAEVSADGGASWREVSLPAPGRQAAVTAITASATGFTAAGESGQLGKPVHPVTVVWTSADGTNWTAARPVPSPAGGRVQEIVGLTSAGGTVTGVGVATTRLGERPVLYTASSSGSSPERGRPGQAGLADP
jgi:hypothetical protein